MKEQTLIEMKNKIDLLSKVLKQTMSEQNHLTTLASGIFSTIRLMPGYDEAIEELKKKAEEEKEAQLEKVKELTEQ